MTLSRDINGTTPSPFVTEAGLAASVATERTSAAITGGSIGGRKVNTIAIGILGQSNERGQVLAADEAAYPQAFGSVYNPAVQMPIPLTNGVNSFPFKRYGSLFIPFYDRMWEWGYDCNLVNGSIGSLSLVRDVCGNVRFRANSTAYGALRGAVAGSGDMGYSGDFTVQGGKVFRCTTGSQMYAFYNNQVRMPNTSSFSIQTITTADSKTSAASDPGTWAATSLGGTVTDGSLVWTNVDNTNSVGMSNGLILNEAYAGFGWDPYGALIRLHTAMQAVTGVTQKWIYICNGPGDVGQTAGNYQTALQNIATYFLNRGYYVALGLSTYVTTATAANYDALSTGVASAVTTLQGIWGASKVKTGANLYTAMGSTVGANGLSYNDSTTHLDAPAAIVAGGHCATAFKAFLPRNN